MTNIQFKHRWVFYLDADERMTPELASEIREIAARWDAGSCDATRDPVAYYCGRKNIFRGKWIRHAMPPGNIMRFFQPPFIRFERLANPTPIVDGKVGYLSSRFVHYNFSKGIREWFDRHNRYSSYEATENLRALSAHPVRLRNVFSTDRNTRRLELKNVSFRLPFRPLIKFVFMYLVGRGFLDGRAGLTYCTLQAIYEYLIVLKVRELRRPDVTAADRGEHVSPRS